MPAQGQDIPGVVSPPVICAASELIKTYGVGGAQVQALRGVTTAFRAGTFTAVMGPSGSGKSTLMHLLAGLDQPTGGHVELAGQALETLSDDALTTLRRDQVGFVFQAFNLLPTHTARQNIVLPLELAGRKVDMAEVEFLAASLGLSDRLDHLPSQLSGGQQQRVAVVRALITHPAVVFADEPTGALDSQSSAHLLGYLRDAARRGQTVVMVTHDPTAASYTDRAVILSDGQIVEDIIKPDADVVLSAMSHLGGA